MHQLPHHLSRGRHRGPFQSSLEKIRLLAVMALTMTPGLHWITGANFAFAEPPHQQYVLLRNDHVLQGMVTSEGSLITVRRDIDAQLTLQADQVLAIRDDLHSLYTVRQSMKRRGTRSNTADLLDDARWCVNQNMPGQATALLMDVYRTTPNHPVALQLEKRLRQSLAQDKHSDQETGVSQSSFTAPNAVADDVASKNDQLHSRVVTATAAPEDLHWFTSRVQPILISRCGQCHHSEASTDWKLVLPTSGTRVPQKGTMTNLQATLKYCNAGNAQSSKLLELATTAHGPRLNESADRNEPPIAEHEIRLMNTVASWINQLVAVEVNHDVEVDDESIGSLAQVAPSQVVAELSPPPVIRTEASSQWGDADSPKTNAASPKPLVPTRLPAVENPNDVRHYNREIEIRRKFGL